MLRKFFTISAILFVLDMPFSLNMAFAASLNSTQNSDQNLNHYLMNHPEIVQTASDNAQQKDTAKIIREDIPSLFFSSKTPSVGAASSPVSIVEFFDYQCGYCKKMFPSLMSITRQYSNTRLVFKELPVLGQTSVLASHVALAAEKQGKYFDMHRKLMEQKGALNEAMIWSMAKSLKLDIKKLKQDMNQQDIQDEIQENMLLAKRLHIIGTPAFVIAQTPKSTTSGWEFKESSLLFSLGQLDKKALEQGIVNADKAS